MTHVPAQLAEIRDDFLAIPERERLTLLLEFSDELPDVPERFVEVGERFLGTVVKTTTFGAFVSLLPGKDGLLHISELRKLNDGKRVNDVEDVVGVGQQVQVEITKVDDRGKLSLSPVVADDDAAEADEDSAAE